MVRSQKILCLFLSLVLVFGLFAGLFSFSADSEAEIPPVTGDPVFTIACISDLHADYGLQKKYPYIRNSVIKTVNTIAQDEDADILLVGGDMTSDNADTSDIGGWTYPIFSKVMEKYREMGEIATESGRSLWVCGNHDFQAGEEEGYNAYADYEDIMVDSCGDPLSVFRQKDDKLLTDKQYPEHVLGMHFNIDGFDFIILNAPYSKSQTYSNGTLNWLRGRLQAIGKDKTVFLVTHYPLTDSRNISTPTYGVSGTTYNNLTKILRNYPNTVYLYGHNHGGSDQVYIKEDTFERITFYTKAGKVINDRNVVPTSFITAFMGSMSYYGTSMETEWLDESDPQVVQALMIYVYKDRIVFQMKNYGKTLSNVVPKSWTVMREIVKEDDQGDVSDSGSDVSSGDAVDTPLDITDEFLVTTKINDKVKYDSTMSIGTYGFDGEAELKSSKNSLVAQSFPEGVNLSVRQLISGEDFLALKTALEPVVTQFVGYNFSVRKGTKAVQVDGTVKITLPNLTDEFGPYTDELTAAAYYLDGDGALHMTDLQISEDRKSISFLLPELVPFALSARANVKDIPLLREEETVTSTTTEDEPVIREGGSILWIVAVVLFALIAVGVLVIVLLLRKKPAGTKPAKKE